MPFLCCASLFITTCFIQVLRLLYSICVCSVPALDSSSTPQIITTTHTPRTPLLGCPSGLGIRRSSQPTRIMRACTTYALWTVPIPHEYFPESGPVFLSMCISPHGSTCSPYTQLIFFPPHHLKAASQAPFQSYFSPLFIMHQHPTLSRIRVDSFPHSWMRYRIMIHGSCLSRWVGSTYRCIRYTLRRQDPRDNTVITIFLLTRDALDASFIQVIASTQNHTTVYY